jgi:hypothetical protein
LGFIRFRLTKEEREKEMLDVPMSNKDDMVIDLETNMPHKPTISERGVATQLHLPKPNVNQLPEELKFDINLVKKYTKNELFVELIQRHNMKDYSQFECMGFNRNQQKEFMSMSKLKLHPNTFFSGILP